MAHRTFRFLQKIWEEIQITDLRMHAQENDPNAKKLLENYYQKKSENPNGTPKQ